MKNMLYHPKKNAITKIKYTSLFFIFVIAILPTYASHTLHTPEKLDLSNSAILCMYQDKNGYMWFGTYDGINLYNGKNTFIYRAELDKELSLCSNIIHNITGCGGDDLWISTFLGLNKFSLKERRITESYPDLTEARLIASDSVGKTWVMCKNNYLSFYEPEKEGFTDIYFPGVDRESVKSLFFSKNDSLYLITIDGKLKKVEAVEGSDNDGIKLQVSEVVLHEKNIDYAFYENDHCIYFISAEHLLYQYDLSKHEKKFITSLSRIMENYGRISMVVSYKSDIFISFSNNGLIRLDAGADYRPVPVCLGVRLFSLLKDKNQDILWIGTDGRGVQMYYQGHDLFGGITFDNIMSSTQKPVRAIYTDEENNLWIGIKGDGVMKVKNYDEYNHGTISLSQTTNYTINDGLSNNSVYCFLRSRYRDVLWIGTEGPGLSYYSYKDGIVRTLPGKAGDRIGKVHSICEINDSILWIATAGQGLLEVTLKTEASHPVVRSVDEYILKKGDRTCMEFHSMFYDEDSVLYIGGRGGYGVVRYNVWNKQYDFIQMENAENSSIGDVLCVYQSRDADFYIGASSGMTRIQHVEDGSRKIKQFDRRNGILNDMIHGILEDSDGCIWLSTNKGLIKYNPRNDFFHGYSNPDLKVTEFSDDAYWECPVTGRLFFGGINGLTWIEPKESGIRDNYYRPALQFFDIQIARESFPLYHYMNKKDSALEIKNDVFSFALSFVAIDYMDGDNYEYAYILEHYNNEWTELQKTNEVSFTNLPAGEYLLKVKYKNDVFDAEENIYTLPIRKLPPWYLTTWAYWVYILLFVLISLFIIYIVRKSIIKRQMQIARNIKEEQKEKLLESKLNFFTHITHEFCTPLTVIRGVSDLIGKSAETDNRLNKYVSILQDNVTNLNDLIQEILDFRRMEEGKYDFSDIEEVEISALIEKQVEWFIPVAEQNRIRLEISVPDELHWNTNVRGFNRILINLISNAFKYTDIEGEVKITAAMNDGQLMLKVYNTGPGIEASEYASVFDRYGILEDMEVSNTYSSATSRNGLGLSICYHITERLKGNITVKSVVDEYAEFTVVLPSLPVTKTKTEKAPEISPIREENRLSLYTANDKKTVLVVDDNKDIVWLITNILSDSYIIKNAYSVDEAMSVIKSETPALIITDIMMPGVDGLEFIRSLKADKFTKHIPIVVISAKISEREHSEGLDIGADVYLTKPFSTLVLRSVVNRLLTVKDELKDYFYSPESAYKHTDGQLMHQEDKAFMDSVITIISDNLEQENLRPEFIADKLNMTTRSLYRRFRKYSTFSPSDFIKDYRFMYAAKLLITTNLTIQEVIYKVGISNKSYFYREFYKKYNMTPKEFRSGK